MKRITRLIYFLLTAGIINVNAQNISVGLRAGMNISNQNFSASGITVSPNSKIGYLGGAFVKIMFNDKMGIQPELFISSVGSKWPASLTGSVEGTMRLNYISLPVFFRYNVTDVFHLLAGPQLGVLASAKGIASGQTTDMKSDFNSTDFGGIVGAGVDFGPINVGARYNFSLSNISAGNLSSATVKNTAFQLVVGYKLFGK